MTEQTNWIPGLVVLAIGAAAAIAFMLGSKKLKTEAPAPKSLDDLKARYQSAIEQLKAHQGQKHLMSADAFAIENGRLEQQATALLRALRDQKHEAEKKVARAEKAALAPAPSAQASTLRGALIGGGVVLLFVFLGLKLSENTTERGENGSMTGGVPAMMGGARGPQAQGAAPEQPPVDPEVEARFQAVEANPENTDAIADLAMTLVHRQAYGDAKQFINRLSALDPHHVRGRVLRTALNSVEGKEADTIPALERLGELYPEAWDARLLAGMISMDVKQTDRAMKNFDAYLKQAPPDEVPPDVRAGITQLLANPSLGQADEDHTGHDHAQSEGAARTLPDSALPQKAP